MHRIDTTNAVANLFGAGKNGFGPGNPATNSPATFLDNDFCNALQEELASIPEAAGIALNKAQRNQVLTAILALIDNYGFGRGQTVQNMLSSRVTTTTYYNTTSRPILVSVSLTSISNAQAVASVGAVLVYGSDAGVSGRPASITFVVPPGVSYSVSATGFASIQSWVELR
jgi:hypothetical protein